ncbi:MAG: amidoligase family protein [Bacteroidaceae bacterium]|nr:amidoligase family protein [Bacteroidaceae bacterium]
MTLSQQIQNIFDNGRSVSGITRELRALGICTREINILLDSYKRNPFALDDITFGVEIECYNVEREEIAQRLREAGVLTYVEGYNHTDYRDHFKVVTDGSLSGNNTAEVVSPILKGKKGLQTLEKVCKVLQEIGAKVNKSCGLHIHFGLANISFETYKNIFYNYAKLERIIDAFMPASRRNNIYCKGYTAFGHNIYELLDCTTSKEDIARLFADRNGDLDRYYKVNPIAYRRHNTIEFRQHSGTVEYKKMLNWIEFLKGLIAYSKENRIIEAASIEDLPFIDSRVKRFYKERTAALA